MSAQSRFLSRFAGVVLCLVCAASSAHAQKSSRAQGEDAEFGPIVRAYLGYLRNQQEVVDDRISRNEIERGYYVRNSNRIRALRRVAIRIARETENDYLPELEAVAADEFNILFDEPPKLHELREGEVLNYQFRFLEAVASGRDRFYVFARLDPYEQAEFRKQGGAPKSPTEDATSTRQPPASEPAATTVRPRRVISP